MLYDTLPQADELYELSLRVFFFLLFLLFLLFCAGEALLGSTVS